MPRTSKNPSRRTFLARAGAAGAQGGGDPRRVSANQFFGQIDIDGRCGDLVLQLKDLGGSTLFSRRLEAHPGLTQLTIRTDWQD